MKIGWSVPQLGSHREGELVGEWGGFEGRHASGVHWHVPLLERQVHGFAFADNQIGCG
jgi:hypothetical protein